MGARDRGFKSRHPDQSLCRVGSPETPASWAAASFDSPDTVDTFLFDDGRRYEVRYQGHVAVGQPHLGDLLIAGSKPDNWILVAELRVPDSSWHVPCYALQETGEEKDTTVELDFGVTLQKAPDYDSPGRNPNYSTRISGGVICLNREGQVRRIF